MTTVTGCVARVTYFNEKNLFAIVRVDTDDGQITALGSLGQLSPGEKIKAEGEWTFHPKYGRQFRVQSVNIELPATSSGICQYLSSGLIRGVGPALAQRIVNRFGEESLNILENNPNQLLEIRGISEKKLSGIIKDWEKESARANSYMFFARHGISPAQGVKILKAYGPQALAVVKENPYRLVAEVVGIGFPTADAIAQQVGFSQDSLERVNAGVLYVLQTACNQGHFLFPYDKLISQAAKMLNLDANSVKRSVNRLVWEEEVVLDPMLESARSTDEIGVYLPEYLKAEKLLAYRILGMLTVPISGKGPDPDKILSIVHEKLAIKLSREQLHVVNQLFGSRVSVVTGGPGTGKTTLIRSALLMFESLGKKVCLAAPTGRAAKRLSEVTQRDASTIHRLLSYDFESESFTRNRDFFLDADVVIIDEASMVDTFLMYHLACAISLGSRLILVGDVSQLPPVGPGNALKDIIKSDRTPVYALETVFRQAEESLIITNAHRINQGKRPVTPDEFESDFSSDFLFIPEEQQEKMLEKALSLVSKDIPQRFGLDPIKDIQVLTPMHKGPVGTVNLNKKLQERLNPSKSSIETLGRVFYPGDKVMQTKNNYKKEVYNGDIGTISEIDQEQKVLFVNYDTNQISYDFDELDELVLAYAISVHKSQGSEYPAVVILLSTSHFMLLQRNLLYTGVTRARELLVLIGSPRAVSIAVGNDQPTKRLTRLCERLSEKDGVFYYN